MGDLGDLDLFASKHMKPVATQATLLPADPLDSKAIVQALRSRHLGDSWAFFRELRVGTGYGSGAEQRIDAWAMNLWPSSGLERVAYEVKISRGDFLTELRKPQKRRFALLYSNYFYFAAPEGLIPAAEVPPEAGLIEIGLDGKPNVKVAAIRRDTPLPSWRFMAAIVRRVDRREVDWGGSEIAPTPGTFANSHGA